MENDATTETLPSALSFDHGALALGWTLLVISVRCTRGLLSVQGGDWLRVDHLGYLAGP